MNILEREFCELLEDFEAKSWGIRQSTLLWYLKAERLRTLGLEFWDNILNLRIETGDSLKELLEKALGIVPIDRTVNGSAFLKHSPKNNYE